MIGLLTLQRQPAAGANSHCIAVEFETTKRTRRRFRHWSDGRFFRDQVDVPAAISRNERRDVAPNVRIRSRGRDAAVKNRESKSVRKGGGRDTRRERLTPSNCRLS